MTQSFLSDTAPNDPIVTRLLSGPPPRAAAFIVTIYGDVVEPRGSDLWIGTLIEICAAVGVNESLVRTAVSRLVASGQLTGARIGRRSYYSLSPSARLEFMQAARKIFSPVAPPQGWLIFQGDAAPDGAHWAEIAPGVFCGPDLELATPAEGMAFRAAAIADGPAVKTFAARNWPLETLDAEYGAFVDLYAPLQHALDRGIPLAEGDALALRLRLTHDYRHIVLREPPLPVAALPEGWRGTAARQLFCTLYIGLSGSADSYVGRQFETKQGHLPASTAEAEARRQSLLGELPSEVNGM